MKKRRSGMLKKHFMPYLKKQKRTVVLDLFCAALTTACELVLPMIVRRITQIAVDDISKLTVSVILQMAALYAVLKGIDMIAGYYMIYVGHSMGVRIERQMREDMFSHLLRVPLSYYDTTKVGQLMSRITTDLFDVSEFSHHCPEEFFIAGLKITVSFTILASINFPLTAASFIILPLMLYGTLYYRRKMRSAFKRRREIAGEVNSNVETSFLGIRIVKSFTSEKGEEEKFKAESEALSRVQCASYRYMARLNSVVRFFDGMMYIILILLGGVFLMRKRITTADYAAYLLYVAMLIAAVKRIVEFTEAFEKGMTGIERFAQVMDTETEETDVRQCSDIGDIKGEIEFRDVTFSYDTEGTNVLAHINLKVEKGESIAIVGPSGSGKTTMCSLLSRFYSIQSGEILLDGKNINELELCTLRRAIGTVEQDVYMFSGTVFDNIRYGDGNAEDQRVIEAAKLAGAHEFIMNLPDGYDTYIGERGTMLSGGQKQRISIARAFLKDPPVLVLDEATSALDNKSEQLVKRSLAELAKDRTTFTVAHRLSTIRNADRILVLTENGIEEQGSHEELMALGGIYCKLYENAQ